MQSPQLTVPRTLNNSIWTACFCLQGIYDKRQRMEMEMTKREQELKQLQGWRSTVQSLLERFQELDAAASAAAAAEAATSQLSASAQRRAACLRRAAGQMLRGQGATRAPSRSGCLRTCF